MEANQQLIRGLPDPEAAQRFLDRFAENAAASARLLKNEALLSDAITLAAFSPLLATTMLQNPAYLWWLEKRRRDSGVRSVEELIESLAQFSLTNSGLEPHELFARFRRRELLRIYLRDIRRLATIAEITEEISNLADAILESALKLAHTEIDNRYGRAQHTDEKGRSTAASFCIAALGKLGSRELNYSSDIDLLFLYSDDGSTTGRGSRGQVTNREYFIKLAEYVVKLLGGGSGEGGAYRVDLRLRPHGSLGALALSVADMVRYCKTEARPWERQVLIRSRACAGDSELFKVFFAQVDEMVFSKDETVESALANVRRSKERIDLEQINRRGFDVKLGSGGIREIEFLAQALQLAHGGHDRWLRIPHTLLSLDRLADRGHISKRDLSVLSSAYEFLRRTEHVLQMENGLQTHTIPDDAEKRALLARRMMFASGGGNFERELASSTANVSRIFNTVFESAASSQPAADDDGVHEMAAMEVGLRPVNISSVSATAHADKLQHIISVSPHFATLLAANPKLADALPDPGDDLGDPDYAGEMMDAVESENEFGRRLGAMRRTWVRLLLEIVVRDIYETIPIREAKRLQTKLAEASIAAAIRVVRDEMARRHRTEVIDPDLAILALGKLGGRGLDYDSDLDLVIVYFDPKHALANFTPSEFYSRVVELFVTTLSSMTRDGNLYRVDLRLRPFGTKGMGAISIDAFLDYMTETAAIWEMLAFVKLRMVGGDPSLGNNVESETRRLIHERAITIEPEILAEETRRVRLALEKDRSRTRRSGEIDIKYGPGGMLDVYFAMRYLQLAWNVPDDPDDRSTPFMLNRLKKLQKPARKQVTSALDALGDGYDFLAMLDHNLRLTVGRTTRVPLANHAALSTIADRMKLASSADLFEKLTIHRLAIRETFDEIVSTDK